MWSTQQISAASYKAIKASAMLVIAAAGETAAAAALAATKLKPANL